MRGRLVRAPRPRYRTGTNRLVGEGVERLHGAGDVVLVDVAVRHEPHGATVEHAADDALAFEPFQDVARQRVERRAHDVRLHGRGVDAAGPAFGEGDREPV